MKPEALEPLSRELLELEKAAPSGQPMSQEAIDRVLQRLESTLVLPLAPPTTPGPPAAASAAPAAAPAGKLGFGLAMLTTGLIVGATVATAVLRASEPTAPLPPPVTATIAQPEPAPAPIASPEPAPIEKLPEVIASRPPRAPPPAAKPRAEQPLLDIARAAIVSGRSKEALDALDRHARDFPNGALAEEREALAVQALSQLGDTAATRARAASFRQRFPGSIFLPAVDAADRP